MPSSYHFGVSMDNRPHDEWNYTMVLATGITEAHIGRAVELDTSGANKVKLATDGGHIFGRLEVVEGNGLGTVSLKFVEALPVKSGETIALGNTVVGAGSGEVKAAGTANPTNNQVVEVRSGFVVVAKL